MAGVKEIKPDGFNEKPDAPKTNSLSQQVAGNNLPRKRTVTSVDGDAFVMYEIPYEKDNIIVAELDKNTANPKTTLSKLKWLWLYNFKGRGVGEWTGAASKPYAEATGQPDTYNIGTHYINSPYARLGTKRVKAGKAFWLEAFSIKPEFKSPVGCFMVMVAEKATIIEVNAEKPLSKCGCDTDKPTEYRYGELLAIKLLIHQIRDQHTVVVQVKSADGKTVLNKSIVKYFEAEKTDDTNNFINVFYNRTGELNVVIDNAWKDALNHEKGQTKDFYVSVTVWDHYDSSSFMERTMDRTFESIKSAVGGGSSTKKLEPVEVHTLTSTKLTLFYDTDEVAKARQQQTVQMVKIGTSLVKTICYDPCKYESITIEETDPGARESTDKENKEAAAKTDKENAAAAEKAKRRKTTAPDEKKPEVKELESRKFVILGEVPENGKQVLKDKTYMTYNLIAGTNKGQREVIVTLGALVVDDAVCHNTPKHKGRVFDTSKIEEAIELEKTSPGETNNSFFDIFKHTKESASLNGLSKTTKTKTVERKPVFVVGQNNTDEQFKFKVGYKYGDMESWLVIFSYLLPAKAQPDLYTLIASTCRYQRPITFAVYPDIKWTLNIKFNFAEIGWFENKKWYKESKYKLRSLEFEQTTININSPDFHLSGVSTTIRGEVVNNENAGKTSRTVVEAADSKKLSGSLGKKAFDVLKNIELGLEAQWDGGEQKVEVTEKFLKDLYQKFKVAFDLYREIASIVKGTHTERAPVDSDQETFLKNFIKGFKKTRSKLSWEFTPPSIAGSLGWYLSPENNSKDASLNNLNSLVYDYAFEFSPIFGAAIKLDLIALIQNAHPIAFVVVKLIDIGATLAGAEVIADLKLSGDLNLKGGGSVNVMTGANTMTDRRYQQDTKAKSLEGNIKIELTLTLKFTQNKTYNLYIYKVIINNEVSAEAKTFFTLGAAVSADDGGLFIDWDFVFGGLKLVVTAKVSVKGESTRSRRDLPDPKPKQNSLIDAGGSMEFVLIKESESYKIGKTYISKKEVAEAAK